MGRLKTIKEQELQRKARVKALITGTPTRPRLSVSVSNRHITAQIIDDQAKKTIVYVSSVGKKNMAETMSKEASVLGTELAKKAKTAKVSKVVFDRGSKLYHGRIKALAEAAREGGLEF